MGKLIWNQWGRLLAITSAVYMIWASFWAYFFRKFFWDMVGGTLGPAGLVPGKNTQPLVNLVVLFPLLQTFTMVLGLFALALEMPLPILVNTAVHRSILLRIIIYFMAGSVGIMVYQGETISVIGEGRDGVVSV
uniref:DUF7727 domain-containing protein n=1 Tax=Kwoniella bestiolae CBS 10118 TaxID=1296100 RepID=A0A1B9FV17_9TREE|nr:hypothetical protein I302_08256 [Kwoniella bestiolae CBS 10118]OCF22605.1 hypothetical protein I302_08256 [Kwoniella bestiolae CBS 10118]